MNLSGIAVKEVLDNREDIRDIIVIHDDLDLPFGKIKIKSKGGDGGHRGISSITTSLDCNEFFRIKVGIGKPENREDIVKYVLSDFHKEEQAMLANLLKITANAAVILAITLNINLAYNYLNPSN
jgi:PTH1 family peptidyl-tRNA hydrolase